MVKIDVDYLYDIYKDEYSDELNENLLSKQEFVSYIESIIEDEIRSKKI